MAVHVIDATVDARGLPCPLPIVRAAQVVRVLEPGSLIEVVATDPESTRDFVVWARSSGNELVEQWRDAGAYRFVIRRR